MNVVQKAIDELSVMLGKSDFPEEFLKSYDQLECLASGRGTETFLVQNKASQQLCVAKCYDRSIHPSARESDILKTLRNDGLPAFADAFENKDMICVVREYIHGSPLNNYREENHLSDARAVDLMVQLCDILADLHEQDPPVIHRDIKPQNIIVRADGRIALIDFDISRTYDRMAKTDTQFVGTRTYAPPEQYGFSQTDCRADLYALGVLLCWLLTGSTDVKTAEIANKRLAAIVRRCAAFSPDDRFPNAVAVKKALLNADRHKQKRAFQIATTASLALVCLCVGFGIGRYTGAFSSLAAKQGVRFREPLIEQAVRLQLGKSAGETLTPGDLKEVKAIYIFGNEVALTREAFQGGLTADRSKLPRGDIQSLEDIALLPNLVELMVNYQNLSNLGPIAELTNLAFVDLKHKKISDVSALAHMNTLQSVNLYDTDVSDVTVLNTCPRLSHLDVGGTLIRSPNSVGARESLEYLSLKRLQLDSLNGIEAFARVRSLELQGAVVSDLSPLQNMASLQTVGLDQSLRAQMERIASKSSFSVTYE